MRYIQPSKSERPARCTFKRTVCLAVCVLTVIGLTGAAAWSLHSVPRLHSIVTNICSNRNSTTCMDEALHILKDILKLLNSDAFRLSPPSTKPVSPSAWQMVRDNGLPYSQCQISAGLYCNCSVELPENNTLTPPTDLFSTQGFDPAVQVNSISSTGYANERSSVHRFASRALYETSPASCSDLPVEREGWNYVKSKWTGVVAASVCSAVKECGEGLWNRVFSIIPENGSSYSQNLLHGLPHQHRWRSKCPQTLRCSLTLPLYLNMRRCLPS